MPRVPPPTLAALTPRHAAIALTALAAGSFTQILVARAYPSTPAVGLAWIAAVALGGALAARHTLRRSGGVGAAVLSGALCGAVAMFLGDLAETVPNTTLWGRYPEAALAGALALTAFGGVVGGIFGLASLSAVRPAVSAEAASSLDGLERVLLSGSIWPALVGLLGRIMERGGVFALALSCAALLWVSARDLRRVVWLRAVTRGKIPAFTIVERGAPSPTIPAFGDYGEAELDGQLVHLPEDRRDSPFRASPVLVAALPRDPRMASAPFVRRAALAALLAAALLGVTATLGHG